VKTYLTTSLSEALGVEAGMLVSLVGAGGKTSVMYGLGRELASSAGPVLLTTTTKVMYPAPGEITVLLGEENEATAREIGLALAERGVLLAGKARLDSKIQGFSPAFVDMLHGGGTAPTVIAECDGARGKSLKVPRDDEPCPAASTDVYVVLVGADCFGKSLASEEIFEGHRIAPVAGVGPDAQVSPDVVVRSVVSPDSYLGRKPQGARCCVFINKVAVCAVGQPTPDADRNRVTSAFETGFALKHSDGIERVVYGSLMYGGECFLVMR
jgi:probable selenium-dependent hydroxylase accessory protein YqeC